MTDMRVMELLSQDLEALAQASDAGQVLKTLGRIKLAVREGLDRWPGGGSGAPGENGEAHRNEADGSSGAKRGQRALARRVVSAVMHQVGAKWTAVMMTDEKRELFDWFFVPSVEKRIGQEKQNADDLVGHFSGLDIILALHSLLAQVSGPDDDRFDELAASRSIGEQSARALNRGFLSGSSLTCALKQSETLDMAGEFSQAIVALPDLLLSASKGSAINFLKPSDWFDAAADALFDFGAHEISDESKAAYANKLVATGSGAKIAARWLRAQKNSHAFKSKKKNHATPNKNDLQFVKQMNDFQRERLITGFLKTVEEEFCGDYDQRNERDKKRSRRQLANLLSQLLPEKDLNPSHGAPLLGVVRKVFTRRPLPPPVAWALVDRIRVVGRGSDKLAQQIAQHMAALWSSSTFVRGTDISLHESVTGILIDLLQDFNTDQLERGGYMVTLITGVQLYLESAVVPVRKLGMRVAQSFSKALRGEEPLEFSDIQGEVFRYDRANYLKGEVEDSDSDDKSVSTESSWAVAPNAGENELKIETHDSDDPNEVVSFIGAKQDDSSPNTGHKRQGKSKRSVWADSSDSDEESETDLDSEASESLAPMGDLGTAIERTKLPAYLCDCLPLLRNDKEYKQVQFALEGLEELVKRQPPDLAVNGLEMATALVHLENRFALDHFAQRRQDILVALASSPLIHKPVVAMLAALVYAESQFVSTRLDVLRIIVFAAKSYSQGQDDGADSHAGSSVIEDENEPIQRVGTVTRVWGRRKKPEAAGHKNMFYAVASQNFFFPLLSPASSHESLLVREPLVMSKLLFSLGALLKLSARRAQGIDRMATAAVKLVLWARFATEEAEVRTASLFCAAQALAALPPPIFAGEQTWQDAAAEISAWAINLRDRDPDTSCRKQAASLCQMLGA